MSPNPSPRPTFASSVLAAVALCGAALLSFATPARTQGTNLLTVNPSFEQDTFGYAPHGVRNIQGWELEYYGYNGMAMRYRNQSADDQPTDGNWLFYLDTGSRATTAVDSRANVTPGRTYRFTFDTTAYDDITYQLLGTTPYILFYDAAGNVLKQVPQMDVQIPNPAVPSYNLPWGTYSVSAVAPPGAAKAGVQIITDRGQFPNSDRRWTRIDNMRLTLVPETKNRLVLRRYPRALEASKPAAVAVRYTTMQPATLSVSLLRDKTIISHTTRTVDTGSGTLDISVPVPANAPVATDYQFEVQMQAPRGSRIILAREILGGVFLDNAPKTGSSVGADNPNLVYAGRWDRRNPQKPTAYWPQSQIHARFTGTSLRMRTNKTTFPTQELVIAIDGEQTAFRYANVEFGERTITLVQGLSDGVHSVTVLQNGESNYGAWEVRGFETDTNRGFLKPEPLPTRRVEIFGDSVSVGGVTDPVVANPNPDNDGDYRNNTYHTFGAFTARALGADYRSIAKGGMGVAGGFVSYNLLDIYDRWTFDGYYAPNALPWDFSTWQADVIIVGIGHNDQFGNNANYVPNYARLILNLRAKYPNAHIFCTNTSITDNPSHFKRAIVPLLSDPKVHFQLFRPYQYHGGHPHLNDHQNMAYGNQDWNGLADWIGDTMGW